MWAIAYPLPHRVRADGFGGAHYPTNNCKGLGTVAWRRNSFLPFVAENLSIFPLRDGFRN
jgi:hypothetical protein